MDYCLSLYISFVEMATNNFKKKDTIIFNTFCFNDNISPNFDLSKKN